MLIAGGQFAVFTSADEKKKQKSGNRDSGSGSGTFVRESLSLSEWEKVGGCHICIDTLNRHTRNNRT